MANPLFGITSTYAAALFEVLDTEFAEVFFNSLKTNKVAILSSTSEVGRRVATGEFTFGVADTDDLYAAVKEGKPVGALFPEQKAFGTLVIPNVLVLLAHAPNPGKLNNSSTSCCGPTFRNSLRQVGLRPRAKRCRHSTASNRCKLTTVSSYQNQKSSRKDS